MFKIRSVQRLAGFFGTLLVCGATSAQEPTGDRTGSGPSGAPALAEVVVTAQKKSESVQRAPADISVVSAADAIERGVVNIPAAENLIPSAKFNVENNEVQVFVRGIGKQIDLVYIPDAVTTVLDGASIPQFGTGQALYDLHSIEVLPGPQGTLYGSSSIGGVVNIVTNRPTHTTEASVLAEYGNFDYKHVTAVGNLSIGDDWSARAALNAEYHSGYNDNGTNDEHALGARLSVSYAPAGDNFTAYLAGSFSRNRSYPTPAQYIPYPGGHPYSFPPTDTSTSAFYPPDGLPNKGPNFANEVDQLTGQFDWRFAGLTLTYIPGYLHQANIDPQVEPLVGFANVFDTNINHYTNELRLSGNAQSRLQWLTGLYQLYNDSFSDNTFGPNFGGLRVTNIWKSYAAFGQATFTVIDGTRLTAGARISRDAESTKNAEKVFPIFPTLARGTVPFSFNETWNKALWKVGAEQDLGADSLLYTTIQTGFNPGTYQANLPDPARAVRPQTMLGYTLGIKNMLFDSRLKLNVEAYRYNYEDMIIQAYAANSGATLLYNAPKTRIQGVQLDTAYSLTHTTKLYGNVGYLDAKFRDFSAVIETGVLQNFAGYQIAFAPEWTATVGAEQSLALPNGASFVLRGDAYLSSSYWGLFSHTGNLYQSGYTKSDLSLTYHSPDDSWELGAWGKNLEDKATIAATGLTGRPYPYAGVVYVNPPRTFGLRFQARFGR